MRHSLLRIIVGIAAIIFIFSGINATNKNVTKPKAIIGVATNGSGFLNVVSDPKIGDIDSYTKLAMVAKDSNRITYAQKASMISDAFDEKLKERISSILCSYGITAKSISVVFSSKGVLEAISVPFIPLNGEMPTQKQAISIFKNLQKCISFKSWEGEPQYVSLMIGRINRKQDE